GRPAVPRRAELAWGDDRHTQFRPQRAAASPQLVDRRGAAGARRARWAARRIGGTPAGEPPYRPDLLDGPPGSQDYRRPVLPAQLGVVRRAGLELARRARLQHPPRPAESDQLVRTAAGCPQTGLIRSARSAPPRRPDRGGRPCSGHGPRRPKTAKPPPTRCWRGRRLAAGWPRPAGAARVRSRVGRSPRAGG